MLQFSDPMYRILQKATVVLLIGLISTPEATAQKVADGDSAIANQTVTLRKRFSFPYGKTVQAPKGTVFIVEDLNGNQDFLKVTYDGFTGWVRMSNVNNPERQRKLKRLEQLRKEQEREERERRRKKREREEGERQSYIADLCDRGFELMLSRISHSMNSADGVTVRIGFENISQDRTIKYITFSIVGYNPVGDPVVGNHSRRSKETVKGVGPIEPGEGAAYSFDNVWYAGTLTCIELHRTVVEYMDGSSFTYIRDLGPISERAIGVNLRGECSP